MKGSANPIGKRKILHLHLLIGTNRYMTVLQFIIFNYTTSVFFCAVLYIRSVSYYCIIVMKKLLEDSLLSDIITLIRCRNFPHKVYVAIALQSRGRVNSVMVVSPMIGHILTCTV